jgi:hypothetical protein
MINLTEEQWKLYEEKYGKLLWKISRHISGDPAIASVEDNYADLVIAAIESIIGFQKKTNQNFDEMIHNPLFGKYTKTCLWNFKNNKGGKITEKKAHKPAHVSIEDNEEILQIADSRSSVSDIGFSFPIKDNTQKKLINVIVNDPDCLTENGFINVLRIANKLKLTQHEVRKQINTLSKTIKNAL